MYAFSVCFSIHASWSVHTERHMLRHSTFMTWFLILLSDALSVPLEMTVNKQNAWQLSVCAVWVSCELAGPSGSDLKWLGAISFKCSWLLKSTWNQNGTFLFFMQYRSIYYKWFIGRAIANRKPCLYCVAPPSEMSPYGSKMGCKCLSFLDELNPTFSFFLSSMKLSF